MPKTMEQRHSDGVADPCVVCPGNNEACTDKPCFGEVMWVKFARTAKNRFVELQRVDVHSQNRFEAISNDIEEPNAHEEGDQTNMSLSPSGNGESRVHKKNERRQQFMTEWNKKSHKEDVQNQSMMTCEGCTFGNVVEHQTGNGSVECPSCNKKIDKLFSKFQMKNANCIAKSKNGYFNEVGEQRIKDIETKFGKHKDYRRPSERESQ